ncbi:MAG: TlpA family protein disulfide reductase [Candidatus Delongbacteria bacterium]|nr:TlpA family protein disulfide reductase [Candidatus Delongbacteria bacterium]
MNKIFFAAMIMIISLTAFAQDIKKAPSFRLESVKGECIELDSLTQKGPVLINFWASWCKPCKDELPDIYKIKKEFEKKGLQVITITVDKPAAVRKAVSFLKTKGLELELLKDSDMKVFKTYGGSNAVPFTFLINTSGDIVFSKRSHTDYSELSKEINKIIE